MPFFPDSNDLRWALRGLSRDRAMAILSIVTLALGIGANAAIFSVVHGVLLRPLPYPQADRLVQVFNSYPLMDLPEASVSIPDYLDRREGVPAFAESALFNYQSINLATAGPPERVVGVRTTASLFPLLGTPAAHGRTFTAAAEEIGNEMAVVLSHDLWRRAYGGDPALVGTTILLDGAPHEVVGVMPPEFAFPNRNIDLWTPFAFTPEQRSDDQRGMEFSQMTARLAPGASVEQAQLQIDAIHERNKERLPDSARFWEASGFGGRVVDLREYRYGELRPTLWLLQGVVALVLLIACLNVASLLLARLSARHKELAVRSALGAGLGRIARQLLGESLILAAAGGVAGLALGLAGVKLLAALGLDNVITELDVSLDPQVLLFTLAITALTGLVTGLLPVVSVWRSDPGAVLKEEGRGTGGGRRVGRLRQALVVAEVALALTLLVGAALLVRTLVALGAEDTGFEAAGVLTARVDLPDAGYEDVSRRTALFEGIVTRLRAEPGVEAAGIVSMAPFSNNSMSGSYSVEGYEPAAGESSPHALVRVVDAGYFETLGIPLLAGRGFNRFDTADAPPVAIVDRTLVDKYFPDSDPLAGRLRRGGDDSPAIAIVGVVDTVKIRDLDTPVSKETIYVPYDQQQMTGMTLMAKTAGDPNALAEPLRQVVLAGDPALPVFDVQPLAELVSESLATRRVSMVLLVAFALLAVVLAAVGVYGVLAFSVEQRQREIGTRMALGAAPREVLRLIVRQGLSAAVIGVALGIAAALGLGRFIAALLYGVVSWDPWTYAGVSLVILAVAAAAAYRPARRAAALDPVEALRE